MGSHSLDVLCRLDRRVPPAVARYAVRSGGVLSPDAPHRWAHWVPPEAEPRWYDTVFYVAALPSGAEAVDVSGETEHAEWRTPGSRWPPQGVLSWC